MNLSKEQLEDLIVTAWEGGSDYWLEISSRERAKINNAYPENKISFAEKISAYLLDGNSIRIIDTETLEHIGDLTLEKINKALSDPRISGHAESFLDGDFDVETTDVILQIAILNGIVYG